MLWIPAKLRMFHVGSAFLFLRALPCVAVFFFRFSFQHFRLRHRHDRAKDALKVIELIIGHHTRRDMSVL